MTQVELIKYWLKGANEGKVASVSIDDDRLIHYSTVIAERYGDKVILNFTRYSLASGKVQKMVTDAVPREDIVFVSGVEAGYKGSLAKFISDAGAKEPEAWLMKVRHMKFGDGYVTAIGDDRMVCAFSGQERTFMYPDAINQGFVEVIEDRRGQL